MVLYTPMSVEEIFPSEAQQYKTISIQGKMVIAQQREDAQLQLVQLLSTDPQDYLQPSFSPGTIIKNDYIHE